MGFWWVDDTTKIAVLPYTMAATTVVVVHGRFIGWVMYECGWWTGRWVTLCLPAQPGGWMGWVATGLVHGLWMGECVGIIPPPLAY